MEEGEEGGGCDNHDKHGCEHGCGFYFHGEGGDTLGDFCGGGGFGCQGSEGSWGVNEGLLGEESGEGAFRDGVAAEDEEAAEAVEGALSAFAGGVRGDAKGAGGFFNGVGLEVAEDEDVAVGSGEGGKGVVQDGEELVASGWFRRICHGSGPQRFVISAAGFGAASVGGTIPGGFEEPAGEVLAVAQVAGFLDQEDEDGLGDIVGLGGELSFGGGVDEIAVALDELVHGGGVAEEELFEALPVSHAMVLPRYLAGGRGEWTAYLRIKAIV